VLALLVSGISLVVLGLFDPKRKSSDMPVLPYRRIALVGLLLPGIFLLTYATLAAFFIWMGGVLILGWFVTNALNAKSRERPDSGDKEPFNETRREHRQMEAEQDTKRPIQLRAGLLNACN
jgi:hypothetical protein